MKNSKDKGSYESRWLEATKRNDTSILKFERPDTFPSFFYLEYNNLTLKILEEKLGKLNDCTKILEVGCGRATASIFLATKRGCDIKPIDYSENAIKIANENLKKYGLAEKAEVSDIFDYKTDDKFDAVISYGVMEHMPDIEGAYRAMLLRLKPGGVMISMNVPEKKLNIQTIFAPLNRTLYKCTQLMAICDDKPWLDKSNRGQTGNVYRTFTSSEMFAVKCQNSGFSKVEKIEVNPFPTINPLPYIIEKKIVEFFSTLLDIRQKIFPEKMRFKTSKLLSRCHFIIAVKPK